MTLAALAFVAGALLLQLQPALPPLAAIALLPPLVAAACWKRALLAPVALACGFVWAAAWAHARMADRLAPELEGRDLELVGVVADLPAAASRGARFELEVEGSAARLPRRIRLAWYAEPAPEIHAGERWRFTARLRRPHGNVNPHGFDYEEWLLERGIGATGYVRAIPAPVRMGRRHSPSDLIERAREAVRSRFAERLGARPAAGILAALAVGDQRSIGEEEWRLFRRTGVTHLMSISGLHVTLVSGLFAWLVAFAWRRSRRLCLALPARKAAAAAAILAALTYTLLAGFGVPAQRTFFMVSVVAMALWSGRAVSPSRALALAAAAVTALDPWAPLAAGFWLSFGAVALIFYVAGGRAGAEPRPVQWARMQWAITVGLAPAVLLLFGQVSVVGPLANAVAIPLVSIVITPLALAAAALPFEAPLAFGAWLVEALLRFLEWCAALPAAVWQQPVPPPGLVLLGLGGVAWLLAPRGVPWRATGLALLAPAFACPAPAPAPGEAWVSVLDVGQGLAVLVRTAGHALLYDAGPALGPGADAGERVVVPLLAAEGVARLDAMVLSHEDNDHIGGASSVIEALEVDALASSLPARHPLNALVPVRRRCLAGDAWQWEGVRFAFLYPAPGERPARRNDRSCVLRVEAGGASVLFTGDLERDAELELLARGAPLRADVVVVPHHGSASSSDARFLARIGARWGIVAAGYHNQFGHPRPEVLARYRDAGTRIARTDLEGAVSLRLAPGLLVQTERERRARYWLQSAPWR